MYEGGTRWRDGQVSSITSCLLANAMVKYPGWSHRTSTVQLQTGYKMDKWCWDPLISVSLLFAYSGRLLIVGFCCQFLSFLFYIKEWKKEAFCSVWADELMGKRVKPDHWNLSVLKFDGSQNDRGQPSNWAGHPLPPTTNHVIQVYNSRCFGPDCDLRYTYLNLASIFPSASILINVLWAVFLQLDSRLLWIRFISLDQAI